MREKPYSRQFSVLGHPEHAEFYDARLFEVFRCKHLETITLENSAIYDIVPTTRVAFHWALQTGLPVSHIVRTTSKLTFAVWLQNGRLRGFGGRGV